MSLSISSQSNSYLKLKLGKKSESNQTASGASSRTQVAQNLQTSSAKTTRSFTLGSKRQSNFVAGQGNTPGAAKRSTRKLQDQYNITRSNQGFYNTRDNSSETVYIRQSNGFGSMTSQMAMLNQMGMLNQMQQAGGIQGTINAGVSLVKEIGGLFGLSSQMDTAMGSLGGNNSTVSSSVSATAKSAISGMTSANDVVSLKQAIEGAKSQEAGLSQSAGQVESKQTAFTNATKAKKDAETSVANKKQDVATKDQTVKTLGNQVTLIKSQLTAASNAVSAANASYQNALNSLNAASTPEEKSVAQAAVNKAKAALEEARATEAKVKQALTEAENKLTNAENELKTAKEEYQKAEDDLATKGEALETAETELDKAKQAKQDYDALSSEIKTQESRLEQLDRQEKEAYSDTTQAIKDREAKVGDKTDDKKLAKLKEKQNKHGDNIVKLQCMSAAPSETGKDGEELRSTMLPSGKMVYFVGMEEVSEDVYNSHKKASS